MGFPEIAMPGQFDTHYSEGAFDRWTDSKGR